MTTLKEFNQLSLEEKHNLIQMEGEHIGRTETGCLDVYQVGEFYAIINEEGSIRAFRNIPELR